MERTLHSILYEDALPLIAVLLRKRLCECPGGDCWPDIFDGYGISVDVCAKTGIMLVEVMEPTLNDDEPEGMRVACTNMSGALTYSATRGFHVWGMNVITKSVPVLDEIEDEYYSSSGSVVYFNVQAGEATVVIRYAPNAEFFLDSGWPEGGLRTGEGLSLEMSLRQAREARVLQLNTPSDGSDEYESAFDDAEETMFVVDQQVHFGAPPSASFARTVPPPSLN